MRKKLLLGNSGIGISDDRCLRLDNFYLIINWIAEFVATMLKCKIFKNNLWLNKRKILLKILLYNYSLSE